MRETYGGFEGQNSATSHKTQQHFRNTTTFQETQQTFRKAQKCCCSVVLFSETRLCLDLLGHRRDAFTVKLTILATID